MKTASKPLPGTLSSSEAEKQRIFQRRTKQLFYHLQSGKKKSISINLSSTFFNVCMLHFLEGYRISLMPKITNHGAAKRPSISEVSQFVMGAGFGAQGLVYLEWLHVLSKQIQNRVTENRLYTKRMLSPFSKSPTCPPWSANQEADLRISMQLVLCLWSSTY